MSSLPEVIAGVGSANALKCIIPSWISSRVIIINATVVSLQGEHPSIPLCHDSQLGWGGGRNLRTGWSHSLIHPSIRLSEVFSVTFIHGMFKVEAPQLILPTMTDSDNVKPGGLAETVLAEKVFISLDWFTLYHLHHVHNARAWRFPLCPSWPWIMGSSPAETWRIQTLLLRFRIFTQVLSQK